MSSKNAVYESSMLWGFEADDELLGSGFTMGREGGKMVVGRLVDVLGFGFGRADSLLTRTDAGTIAVSSGVCCARGLFTTVDAADLTYDGF